MGVLERIRICQFGRTLMKSLAFRLRYCPGRMEKSLFWTRPATVVGAWAVVERGLAEEGEIDVIEERAEPVPIIIGGFLSHQPDMSDSILVNTQKDEGLDFCQTTTNSPIPTRRYSYLARVKPCWSSLNFGCCAKLLNSWMQKVLLTPPVIFVSRENMFGAGFPKVAFGKYSRKRCKTCSSTNGQAEVKTRMARSKMQEMVRLMVGPFFESLESLIGFNYATKTV